MRNIEIGLIVSYIVYYLLLQYLLLLTVTYLYLYWICEINILEWKSPSKVYNQVKTKIGTLP